MNKTLCALILASMAYLTTQATADPLDGYRPEAIAGAVKLRDSLAGSVWIYTWREKVFEFSFGKSGDLKLLESWEGVRWRVLSPNEVILDSATGHMLLRFDPKLQEFTTKDWDGEAATGRQKAKEGKQGQQAKESTTTPLKVNLRPEFEKLKLGVCQQGKRGACQVFAMVGVMEFQLARRGKQENLSEQFLMWAANEAKGLNRTGGFNPDLLIAGLKKYGICEESLMPYVPREEAIGKPSIEALQNARTRTSCKVISIKHWPSEIGFGGKEIKEISKQLDNGVPVTATLCWPSGLSDEQIVDTKHFIIDKNIDGKSKDGHGVILVGYELDEQVAGGGFFILRNSWGPKFADKGYAMITFEYGRKYGIDAYIVSVGE